MVLMWSNCWKVTDLVNVLWGGRGKGEVWEKRGLLVLVELVLDMLDPCATVVIVVDTLDLALCRSAQVWFCAWMH